MTEVDDFGTNCSAYGWVIFSIAGLTLASFSLLKKLCSFSSSGGCIATLDARLYMDGGSSEVDFSLTVKFISHTSAGNT